MLLLGKQLINQDLIQKILLWQHTGFNVHRFATRLVQSGVDLITVRDLLGHFSIRVTQRYAHTNRDQKINAVELLKHHKAEKVGKKTGNLLHIRDIETKSKREKTASSSYLIN